MHDPAVQLSVVQLLLSLQLGVILKSKKAASSGGPFPKSPFTALIHSRKRNGPQEGAPGGEYVNVKVTSPLPLPAIGESCVTSVFPLCVLGGALVRGPGPSHPSE